MRPHVYEITFTGRAGAALHAEFDDCEVTLGPDATTLRADLPDQAALYGLLHRIDSFGLELTKVQIVAPAEPDDSTDQPAAGPASRCRVEWRGQQAIVGLPEHVDVSTADQIREQLLMVINRGAIDVIADMAATVSCDYAGAAAVARAHQRALANGTPLRLVVTAQVVRQVLIANGLDRLISVYPSLDAAVAAWSPAGPGPGPGRPGA